MQTDLRILTSKILHKLKLGIPASFEAILISITPQFFLHFLREKNSGHLKQHFLIPSQKQAQKITFNI